MQAGTKCMILWGLAVVLRCPGENKRLKTYALQIVRTILMFLFSFFSFLFFFLFYINFGPQNILFLIIKVSIFKIFFFSFIFAVAVVFVIVERSFQ